VSRRKAERLLHDIRQLQVGKSTFADARAKIVGHGGGISPYNSSGCSPARCTFEVSLEHYPVPRRALSWLIGLMSDQMAFRVVHVFTCLGLQDWQAGSTVQVDGGIVSTVDFRVLVRDRGDSVLGRTTYEFRAVPAYLQDGMGQRSYSVNPYNITTFGGGEGIESYLTPLASTEEIDRAFDLDFDCLTRLGGCTSLCQMAPLEENPHNAPRP